MCAWSRNRGKHCTAAAAAAAKSVFLCCFCATNRFFASVVLRDHFGCVDTHRDFTWKTRKKLIVYGTQHIFSMSIKKNSMWVWVCVVYVSWCDDVFAVQCACWGRCKFRLIGGPVYWRFSRNNNISQQQQHRTNPWQIFQFASLAIIEQHTFSLLPISNLFPPYHSRNTKKNTRAAWIHFFVSFDVFFRCQFNGENKKPVEFSIEAYMQICADSYANYGHFHEKSLCFVFFYFTSFQFRG